MADAAWSCPKRRRIDQFRGLDRHRLARPSVSVGRRLGEGLECLDAGDEATEDGVFAVELGRLVDDAPPDFGPEPGL